LVFLIHTELRCTANHTTDIEFYLFSFRNLSTDKFIQFLLVDDEKLWNTAGILSKGVTKILEYKPVPMALVDQKSHMD